MSDGLAAANNPEAQPNEKDTAIPDDKDATSNSLEEFWKDFRISPNGVEHSILTHPLWLSLVAVGPLILLIFFKFLLALASGSDSVFSVGFSDLEDPIFLYITLSLLFAALLYSLDWYPHISPSFQSLLANQVIYTRADEVVSPADFLRFLEDYRNALHDGKRYIYPIIFTLLLTTSTVLITLGRGAWLTLGGSGPLPVVELLHFLTRWVLAPAAWGFVGGLGLRAAVVTAKVVDDITPRFQINVLPYHSDRAGGLKKIGDLCSRVGLLVIVIVIPAIFLSVQETAARIGTYHCGAEIRQFLADDSIEMTEERFARCVYYSQGGAISGLHYADILDEVGKTVTTDVPLRSVAEDYYSKHERLFQREYLLSAYDIFYAMDFFIILALIFAVMIVIKPMWDIHRDMLAYRQKREREANDRISGLYHKLTKSIGEDNLEEAGKVKENISFYTGELAEIQKYPTWPLSHLPVLRSYLSSGLLSAVVTYLISALNVTISPEARALIEKLINP